MKTLDNFLPYVVPSAFGVPEPMAIQALRFAAIEFCRRTDIVQRILTVNVVASTQDYAVAVPTDMVFSRVIDAFWQGNLLKPVAPASVEADTALRGATVGTALLRTGSPQFYFQKGPSDATLSLAPVPDTSLTGGLTIKASFVPTMAATQVEDVLFDEWCLTIASGALAYLQNIPGQPFSAPSGAASAMFNAGISQAKRVQIFGKLTAPLRVRPQRFAK